MSKSFIELAKEELSKEDAALLAAVREVIYGKPYGKHLRVVENEVRDSIKDERNE